MELFTNQILAGIATGAIYACMALAVVMIYQAIDHLNFAQGENGDVLDLHLLAVDAMGVPYWGAFVLTLAFPLPPASRSSGCCSGRWRKPRS